MVLLYPNSSLFQQGELLAVFLWSKAGLAAEHTEEIVIIGNTDLLADLTVGKVGGGQQIHGPLDAQAAYIFVDAATVGFLRKLV